MLHNNTVKKNKHTITPVEYLYENHVSSRKLSGHLSAKTRAELNDDIYYMRRQFKRTVRMLARDLYGGSWKNSRSEDDIIFNEQIKLRSNHA